MHTTYSFQDVSVVISNPDQGQYVAQGEGFGGITITMNTDRSAHDVAADGSVMVSKIRARNGNVALTMQQTSGLHRWLLKLYNYLEAAGAGKWADTKIVVRSPLMQDLITCTGVSPQKLPDKPYQAQGQNVTWNWLAADIDQSVA